jgi:hypothetical protein
VAALHRPTTRWKFVNGWFTVSLIKLHQVTWQTTLHLLGRMQALRVKPEICVRFFDLLNLFNPS